MRFMISRALLLILAIVVLSCNRFSSSRVSVENLQSLDTLIDYTSVDDYPLFSNCQEDGTKEEEKSCFEQSLTKLLETELRRYKYPVERTMNDSTFVDLLINSNGKTRVVSISSSESIQEQVPQLDSLIRQSVEQLPIIKAATKRGIPIKSQYTLAVVLRSR